MTTPNEPMARIQQLAEGLAKEIREHQPDVVIQVDSIGPQFVSTLVAPDNEFGEIITDLFQNTDEIVNAIDPQEIIVDEYNEILRRTWKRSTNERSEFRVSKPTVKGRIRELWVEYGACFKSRARSGEKLSLLLMIGKELTEQTRNEKVSQLQLMKGKNENVAPGTIRKRLQIAKWLTRTFPDQPERLLSIKPTFYNDLSKLRQQQMDRLTLKIKDWL